MEKSRVLIVEDDEITRSFLVDILENDGYEVSPAGNGKEALEILRERKPDIILSDVLMPEVSGLDLFRKVQADENLQGVPFIFLTSLDDGDSQIGLKELGPDDYITKPVRPRHLLATVKGKLVWKQRRDEQAERERGKVRDRIRWTLSHELRTPLTIIQGISELLLNEGQTPAATEYQELLQGLRSQSFHLGQLVENFLLVNRIDGGSEEENWKKGAGPVPIADIIDEVAYPLWEKTRARGARFIVDVPRDIPPVHAYRPHLLEVFRQVIDNAFKFADPGKPSIEVRGKVEGDRVRVTVTDNGKGIASQAQELLFQKLSQVDREVQEQQGSGLGLYIAKQLIDLNRGAIAVRSQEGHGAEVVIEVPMSPPAKG
jgi:two-component system sensor histidine kinase/response regulator